MTKRLIISVVCLVMALTLSIAGYCCTEKKLSELHRETEQLEISVASGENTVDQSKALFEKWQSCRVLIGALVKHSDADTLDRLFALTAAYACSDDREELFETITELKIALTVIKSGESPAVENVLYICRG